MTRLTKISSAKYTKIRLQRNILNGINKQSYETSSIPAISQIVCIQLWRHSSNVSVAVVAFSNLSWIATLDKIKRIVNVDNFEVLPHHCLIRQGYWYFSICMIMVFYRKLHIERIFNVWILNMNFIFRVRQDFYFFHKCEAQQKKS